MDTPTAVLHVHRYYGLSNVVSNTYGAVILHLYTHVYINIILYMYASTDTLVCVHGVTVSPANYCKV